MPGPLAVIAEQSALFVGRRAPTSPHRHHALEINLCAERARIEATAAGAPVISTTSGYLVGADVRHTIVSSEGTMVILYVDAEAIPDASPPALVELPEAPARDVVGLVQAWIAGGCAEEQARPLLDRALDALELPRRPRALDPRIARARDLFAGAEGTRRVDDVAERLGVSRSHLAELFTREIGIPPRAFRKWHRLCVGLLAAFDGASLTEAAHLAGFADSAHLSRTCREMFGLPPSRFIRARRLHVARAADRR